MKLRDKDAEGGLRSSQLHRGHVMGALEFWTTTVAEDIGRTANDGRRVEKGDMLKKGCMVELKKKREPQE